MKSIIKKNVVAGLGEIGLPIFKILSKNSIVTGYDINEALMTKNTSKKYQNMTTLILHICIPFSNKFVTNVQKLVKKFDPEILILHSTISPMTTSIIQSKLKIPVIYSATRGVHKRMISDLKKYTKFFALDYTIPHSKLLSSAYTKLMKKSGIKIKKMSSPITLELSKIICDTTYYGWLINYAQMSKIIADKFSVDYDEMWSFSEEIHKFLGNRPKLFPGFIGGHCVIPNLELLNDNSLNQINKINSIFKKFLGTKTL